MDLLTWHFRSFVAFREGIRPATKRDPSSLSRSRIFSCRQIQRCQSLQSASRTRVFKDSRPNLYQNSSRAFQALFLQKLIQVSLWHCYGWPLSNGKIVINVKKYKKKVNVNEDQFVLNSFKTVVTMVNKPNIFSFCIV